MELIRILKEGEDAAAQQEYEDRNKADYIDEEAYADEEATGSNSDDDFAADKA